jgi:hypothetical protein
MNNKYFMVLISLNLAISSGCVFKEPYPNQWKAISTVPGECPEIHGTFSDDGELDPAEIKEGLGEHFWQTTLSSKFFLAREGAGPVSHVEIIQNQIDVIRFIGWNGDEVAFDETFSARNKDFTCKSGFIEFVGDRECEVVEGVMACETPEAHLNRSNDGALIMKYNSRGFGLVYLIPAVVSEWHWYRFTPYPPNETY